MKITRLSVMLLCLVLILPVFAQGENQKQREKEIIVIGTAHVFNIEEKIREKVVELEPDAVAVELDRDRFNSLVSSASESGEIGKEVKEVTVSETIKPEKVEMDEKTLQWLFIFAAVQTEMAKSRNAYAGEDMLAGIEAAYELEIPVYPIDMHMSVTMTGAKEAIGGSLTQFQKCLGTLYVIQDLLSSLNPRLFLKNPALLLEEPIKILKETMNVLLVKIRLMMPLFSALPGLIISIISPFGQHPIFTVKFFVNSFRPLLHSRNLFQIFFGFFSTVISTLLTLAISSNRGINAMRSLFKFSPEIYSAMLEEREEFMSQQIFKMSEEHDRIVVITGAAHLTGLEEKIREKMPDAKIETINFVDLL